MNAAAYTQKHHSYRKLPPTTTAKLISRGTSKQGNKRKRKSIDQLRNLGRLVINHAFANRHLPIAVYPPRTTTRTLPKNRTPNQRDRETECSATKTSMCWGGGSFSLMFRLASSNIFFRFVYFPHQPAAWWEVVFPVSASLDLYTRHCVSSKKDPSCVVVRQMRP